MPSAHFETLMRHHAWAVQRLLDAASLVTPAQLEADVISHGTVLATLRHVADVDQSWGRTAQGQPAHDVKRMEEEFVDLSSLRVFWLAEAARLVDFACSLSPLDLDRDVHPLISDHRAEHGNQIGWHLTTLGHSPGDMGFMGFVDLQRQRAA